MVKSGRRFHLDYDRPKSIGKIKSGYGSFALDLRALVFALVHGEEGLKHVAHRSVLNSNYAAHKLGAHLPRPFRPLVKHEFLLSGAPLKERGVRTLDLAKRLLDEGVHAPTIYFPSLVEEALMIELPESESRRSVDAFIAAFERSLSDTPENLRTAPHATSVGRIDEVEAARHPLLSWKDLRASAAVPPPG